MADRKRKRNTGPNTRTGGAVKTGMFRDERTIQEAGFKSRVPTTPQNKDKIAARRPGSSDAALKDSFLDSYDSAEDGSSNSLRSHAAVGPNMTEEQKRAFQGHGGNVRPSPSDEAVRVGNNSALKNAGLDATRTRTYTNSSRFRGKR